MLGRTDLTKSPLVRLNELLRTQKEVSSHCQCSDGSSREQTNGQFQSWIRETTKSVGSASGEKRSSRRADSPMTAKGAVRRRWALKRNRIAKDAVNASDKQ